MKKFLCLLLLCGMVAALLPGCGGPEWAESPIEDFEYEENEDGGITITKYLGEDAEVSVPRTVGGKPVTKIGEGAFDLNMNLHSVKLPDTVTVIGEEAFNMSSLADILLPEGLTEIGPRAFFECRRLTGVSLPDSLLKIGTSAFQYCESVKEITIPSSIREWGSGTFACSGIEAITFEKGVECIGPSAFAATQIRRAYLPGSLKTVPTLAFAGCKNLKSVTLEEGIETVEKEAFGSYTVYGKNAKITELVIPVSMKNITEEAFTGCEALKKVKFEGNAPADFSVPPVRITDANGVVSLHIMQWDFKVCFHEGAEGFTLPKWNDYITEIW